MPDPNGTQGDDNVPSLRDFLDDAVETTTPAADPAAVAPAQPTEAAPQPSDGRKRGQDGRFSKGAATDDTPAHVRPAPAGPAPAVAPAAVQPQANGAAAPPDGTPASWKPEAQALWGQLPPAVRDEVTRREREVNVVMQRAHQAQEFSESLMSEFRPYAEILKQEGATPQGALRTLLETAYTLRHGSPAHKQALFLSLAQQYGIRLDQPFDANLARAQWEADSMRHHQMRNNAGQEAQVDEQVQTHIAEFAAQPGHEHFMEVKGHMAALLDKGQATDMQDAYDQAVWANPKTRQQMLQQQQTVANVQRATDLNRNRAAASAVTGGPGAAGATKAVNNANLRDTIEAAFDGSRV